MAADVPKLRLLGTSTLSTPVTGGHLACNPAIDLTATVGEANATLHVWRANDQLVSKHVERGKKVEGIRWKENGQFLAAGWSDGVVRLMGLESSKAVHHIRVYDSNASTPGEAKIGFISWSRNVTGESKRRRKGGPRRPERGVLLDGERTGDVALDLPHELTFLEVETALPKLSPLPVSGGSGDDMFLFSTTASLEFVFRPCMAEDADDVHVMVVGTADGGIHLSIYDSFVIGTFKHSPRTAKAEPGSSVFQLCGHGSHPEISSHMLLLRPQRSEENSIYLVPMDLTFIHHSPVNLSLLASKTTTLQNLLRYLKQTQSHMVGEWKSTRELPGRFLLGVQDDLKKIPNGGLTIVQALCHTVVTGHIFPPVKEWLVDSLAERGHKRWEKAVVSGLVNLRSLVHENFVPALERCGVILSRLLGIARFHGSEDSIGFNEAQINKLVDITSSLLMVAHKILLIVMDELEQFAVFSAWLRLEIDKQASSSLSEELTEKEATMDNLKVLSYIQNYLISSPLALYFGGVDKEDHNRNQALIEQAPSLLDVLDRELQRQEAGQPYMKELPQVDFLLGYLTSRANIVFKGIAQAEEQGVRFGQATELSVGQKIWKHDIQVNRQKKNYTYYVYGSCRLKADGSQLVYLIRADIPIINGVSGPALARACGFGVPVDTTIVDFRFLDDKSLLLLCSRGGMLRTLREAASHANDDPEEPKPALLHIAYQSANVPYREYTEGRRPPVMELDNIGDDGFSSWFGFSSASSFAPAHMEVQRANDLRGEIPARICLLGRDRMVYKIYALPEELASDRPVRGAGSQ
ncbi:Anaphase-promoting complex subunit 4 [Madurella mycetomatis]|uniref:Anaphase-promoting complex subunit 4 n=1 Tax=Madurella mycetomatis TaxID=100816 RepID=A0A175W6C6_9PEZI|nr:Anaphase-promoting complex subunit 4 [Madurella mycetomatis]